MPKQGKASNVSVGINTLNVWALGICMGMSGQFLGWNFGLSCGLGSFMIALALTASGYICLVFCAAEISSGLPFNGGSYGIARVTLGIFPGYMMGCFDTLTSIVYVGAGLFFTVKQITFLTEWDIDYEQYYYVAIFVLTLCLQMLGTRVAWWIITATGIILVGIVLLYIIVTAEDADFYTYGPSEPSPYLGLTGDKWFYGGSKQFITLMPWTNWMFIGIEAMNLASSDARNPKQTIPRAYFIALATVLCSAVTLFFLVCSTKPGMPWIMFSFNPLAFGFMNGFKILEKDAVKFALPSYFAQVFGYTLAFSRQIQSMAGSGILHPWLGATVPGLGTPYAGIIAGWCIVLTISFCSHYKSEEIGASIVYVSYLLASTAYIGQFLSYIAFKRNWKNVKREFNNPIGEYMAYWGILVFSLTAVSMLGYQDDDNNAIKVFFIFVGACVLYYYFVVRHRQFFSKDEQRVLFAVHVQKNNAARRRSKMSGGHSASKEDGRMSSAQRVGPASSSTGGVFVSSGKDSSVRSRVLGWIGAAVSLVYSPPEKQSARSTSIAVKNNKVGIDKSGKGAPGRDQGTPSARRAAKEMWAQKAIEKAKSCNPSPTVATVSTAETAVPNSEPSQEVAVDTRVESEQLTRDNTLTSIATENISEEVRSCELVPGAATRAVDPPAEQSYMALTQGGDSITAALAGLREVDIEASASVNAGTGLLTEDDHEQREQDSNVIENGDGIIEAFEEGESLELPSQLSAKQLHEVLSTCNESFRNEATVAAMISRSISHEASLRMVPRQELEMLPIADMSASSTHQQLRQRTHSRSPRASEKERGIDLSSAAAVDRAHLSARVLNEAGHTSDASALV